jgi:Pyruvate/2-oxoacid:ferredoxin oxidoreductase delta subunit
MLWILSLDTQDEVHYSLAFKTERKCMMTSKNIYEKLGDVLSKAGGAIPVIPNEEFFLLLKNLVDEEEAALAIELPRKPTSAEALAERLGRSNEDVASKLESMTNKGVLHALKNKEGIYEYSILPLLPGIFEAQFYRGTKTKRDYIIAERFKNYLGVLTKLRDSLPKSPRPPSTSYFRVLPIEEEIEAGKRVLPYAQLSQYVEKTQAVAVGTCFCRHYAILLDENDHCGVSHNNCMAFGQGAIFVSERHNGRLIDKDEALQILKKAEEEGLVHCSANTSEELAFICNCCSCHCGILSMAKAASSASTILTSGYHAQVDPDLCTACETCLERCPVSAVSIDDVASVDHLQCIGCGLCVSTCSSEAMNLAVEPDTVTPPKKLGDLEKVLKEARV